MKNTRCSKRRRTVVLLLPELLELNLADWVAAKLKNTGGDIVSENEIGVDPEDIEWLCPYRGREYRQLAAEHLVGKIVKIIVIEGPNAVRRVRQAVGKQQQPHDWPPSTIRGALRDQNGIIHRETSHGKKYFWPYVMCPQSNAAAKRLLKRLKVLLG